MKLILFKKTGGGSRNIFATIVMACVWPSLVPAQMLTAITPTSEVGGLGTTVRVQGHTVQITGGTRPGGGSNLFHSFDQFSVGSADTAQFLNSTPSLPTSNILSRVTGGSPSAIFGKIDTMSYPGANLFLMNPAGIVLGSNATLNVSGSVAFTTANYLRLAETGGSNAGIFHADAPATSLLTSTPVVAFGFLGTNPTAISVQGSTLTLQSGQSISIVGGNNGFTYINPDTGASISVPDGVTVTGGHFQASNGEVNIAGLASPGEILAGTLNQAPNIKDQSFGALGTIQILQQSHIDASGEEGGTILIRGGRLIVDDSRLSANTMAAGPGTDPKVGPSRSGIDIEVTHDAVIGNDAIVETNVESGAQRSSGGVRLSANDITVSGGQKVSAFVATHPPGTDIPFGIRSNAESGSTAEKSGDISLTASSSIQIKDRGQIKTATESIGHAGQISLTAAKDITLDSANLISQSATSSGSAGNIMFRSTQGNVTFTNTIVTSQVSAGSGSTGMITIDSPQGSISLEKAAIFNSAITVGDIGALGEIQITGKNLFMKTSIITGNNFAVQPPGNITIRLEDRLNLSGHSIIQTGTLVPANAADLSIKAHEVLIAENSSLIADTISSSAGGAIKISAHTLTIQNGGTISAKTFGTSPGATGGSIAINTTDGISMTHNASITASSTGSANAGNITINAGQQLEVLDNSSISTQAAKASGGNIDIRAIDRIRFVNSTVSTSVLAEDGKGGNIFIDPNVVILEGSEVTAKAVGGAGGNITFVTPLFLADSASLSLLSAKSESGLNGTVLIQSPTSNLSGAVGQLVSKTSPPQVLLQNRCVALAGGEQSTFILTGRDALPSQPGGWLSSPVAMEHWTGDNIEEHASGLMVRRVGPRVSSPEMSQVQGTEVLSLRRLTPSGFLVRSFADRALTGCRS